MEAKVEEKENKAEEILKKASMDDYLQEISAKQMNQLQKDLLLDIFLWMLMPMALMITLIAGMFIPMGVSVYMALVITSTVITGALVQMYKSWMSKRIAGKMIHSSLYITPKGTYSIEWCGTPLQEIEFGVDGKKYYLQEIMCDELSDIDYLLLVSPVKYGEAFKFEPWIKFYKGTTANVNKSWDTLVELECLDGKIVGKNRDKPIPIAYVLDCDWTRREIMKESGHLPIPDVKVVVSAVKKYDELQSGRMAELLSLKDARIKELESTLKDYLAMAGKTVARLLHNYRIFGELKEEEEQKKSLWEKMSSRAKLIVMFAIIGIVITLIIVGVMM
jgi:hypothetical protein